MSPNTTKWGAVLATALAFILFVPDQIAHIPYAGAWLLAFAKFAAIGGAAKLGIEARDK